MRTDDVGWKLSGDRAARRRELAERLRACARVLQKRREEPVNHLMCILRGANRWIVWCVCMCKCLLIVLNFIHTYRAVISVSQIVIRSCARNANTPAHAARSRIDAT